MISTAIDRVSWSSTTAPSSPPRWRKSCTAGLSGSPPRRPPRRTSRSPCTPTSSRLVATIDRAGSRSRSPTARSRTWSSTCSQLSSTRVGPTRPQPVGDPVDRRSSGSCSVVDHIQHFRPHIDARHGTECAEPHVVTVGGSEFVGEHQRQTRLANAPRAQDRHHCPRVVQRPDAFEIGRPANDVDRARQRTGRVAEPARISDAVTAGCVPSVARRPRVTIEHVSSIDPGARSARPVPPADSPGRTSFG